MTHMSLDDFEARYRADPDPWGYETSDYERAKYDATLAACGSGPFTHALELGSSIGVLTADLALRCARVTAIDASPTAVEIARRRLTELPVEIVLGTIPEAIPDGRFDLVVASEILYYLSPASLDQTLVRLERVTAAGALVVAVHWRPEGTERPFSASEVHDRLRAERWLAWRHAASTDDYLLDVLVRA